MKKDEIEKLKKELNEYKETVEILQDTQLIKDIKKGMLEVNDIEFKKIQQQKAKEIFDDLKEEIVKLKKFTDVVRMLKIYGKLKEKHLK